MSHVVSAALAEQINALLDGELSEADAASLEPVLQQNAAARALLKSLAVQKRALHAQFPLPPMAEATQALLARVMADADRRSDSPSVAAQPKVST